MKLSALSHSLSFLLANLPSIVSFSLLHDRRHFVTSILTSSVTFDSSSSRITTTSSTSESTDVDDDNKNIIVNKLEELDDWKVTLPLEYCRGGVSSIRLTVYTSGDNNETDDANFRVYRVIVDSGSPYIVLSSAEEDILFQNNALPKKSLRYRGNNIEGRKKREGDKNKNDTFFDDEICNMNDQNSNESHVYEDTAEVYGSQLGKIQWKCVPISFRDSRLVTKRKFGKFVLGVLDDVLTKESGGSLIGLIKNTNPLTTKIQLRPTFLEQQSIAQIASVSSSSPNNNFQPKLNSCDVTDKELSIPPTKDIASFQIDYPNQKLTLSSTDLIPAEIIKFYDNINESDVMSLVDLRDYGDFVDHYACLVHELIFHDSTSDQAIVVNSNILDKQKHLQDRNNHTRKSFFPPRPIVAVFDTGLTGCLLTQPFWDELLKFQPNLKEKSNINASHDEMVIDPSKFTSIQVRIKIITNSGIKKSDGKKQTSPKRINHEKLHNYEKERGDANDVKCVNISSTKLTNPYFYVAPISLDWFDDEVTAPHVIVLGQTFLSQGALTIDIDKRKAMFLKEQNILEKNAS